MCFSVHMSFLAAGVLSVIGLLSLRKVTHSTDTPLAALPLIFALQQYAEGILWLWLPTGTYPILLILAKYIFLTIATIVWPLYIPFTLLIFEPVPIRRAFMASCLVLAMGWALGVIWYGSTYGALAEIRSCHIYYEFPNPGTNFILNGLIYCFIILAPFFASSYKTFRIFGGLIALSCIITYLAWYYFFVSVWCFFAALLSTTIYFLIPFPVKRTISSA